MHRLASPSRHALLNGRARAIPVDPRRRTPSAIAAQAISRSTRPAIYNESLTRTRHSSQHNQSASIPSQQTRAASVLQSSNMPHATESFPTVHPITHGPNSKLNLGAEIRNANLEHLDDEGFAVIEKALYEHNVVLFKSQQSLAPKFQYELTKRFDPSSTSYGHDKKLVTEKSVIARDISNIPHQPQVQVIGNGPVAEFEGLKNITLKHPHHNKFHATAIGESEDRNNTRFYRWHIDAALYGLNPPRVTSLMAIQVPKSTPQTLRYDDGSNDKIDNVPRGSTAFISSYEIYNLLSEEDKEFARTTMVQYAPHPYIWMSTARSRSDGLGLVSEDKELSVDQLPPIDESKICTLPMCWKNPVTERLALQVHPSAIQKLILKDGTVIDNLIEAREIVHRLQRPGISSDRVWCVDWEEGDLVLFHNHGVLHSVTGSFQPEEVRIFRQCNLASSQPPLSPA